MKKNVIVIFIFNFLFNVRCLTEGVYFPKKENIIILTDYTFEEAFKEYDFIFISVYSEICRICTKKINPSLSLLYKEIEMNEEELYDKLVLAKIDGSYNHYFMKKYNIIGYPTLILFNKGKIISQLNNKYEIDDTLIFLRKNILRPIQYISNIKKYNRLIHNSYKEPFITYFGNNSLDIKALNDIGYTYKYLTFVNIYNISLTKELNFSFGDLSINKFFDEPMIVEKKTNINWDYTQIEKFIKKYNHKLLIEFNTKEGENLIKNKNNILLMINKQEFTKEQIKKMKYLEKINIKEFSLNNENKINQKNFMKLAKLVRDKIQSSFILYKKNYLSDSNNNKKSKRRSILDEQDPFGFEYQRQESYECEKRQIKFINKLNLDNDKNCEIRLIQFNKTTKIKVYKLNCGEENIKYNEDFIGKLHNNTFLMKENKYEIIDYSI